MSDDADALDFFNGLSGHLDVKLTEAAKPVSEHVMNLQASPTARLDSIGLRLSVYEPDNDPKFRPLTDAEWSRVVLHAATIRMRGETEKIVEHAAPNGASFTVRELAAAVEETERQGRGDSQWLGGIDVHHVFFEGIEEDVDGVWTICWGS
jgi:hypothetical protein